MRLALGIFFIVLGICGIFTELNESVFEMKWMQHNIYDQYFAMEVVFGVIELICGLLLVMGFFLFKDSKPVFWGGFIAFIAWTVRIIFSKFFWGLTFISRSGRISIPDFAEWALVLTAQIIIGLALLIVIKRYE